MLINLEKILKFLIYFYSLNLNSNLYIKKNFFLGKLGVFNFFKKFFFEKKNFIFNFYKSKFLKFFFLNFKNNKYKLKYIKKKKIIFNYNYEYYLNLLNLNKLNFFIDKLKYVFYNLGFMYYDSLEIDNDFNNFYFLNISKIHPSLSFNDTFYLNFNFLNKILLRTHSSNFQSLIKLEKIPLKIFTIGKTYRPDNDHFHLPIFNQLDIFWVSKFLNFLFLKNFINKFINLFFINKKICYRFRSSYFPFTYLSYEIDLLINFKNNKKWLEFCGLGIVNNKILNNININFFIYKALAIGMGIERLFMCYYNLENLNNLY